MGNKHSISARPCAHDGDASATVAAAGGMPPPRRPPPALNSSLMEPRWAGGRLSVEQAADLCTSLARLLKALADAFPEHSAEQNGTQPVGDAADAQEAKGGARTSSSVLPNDSMREEEEAAALLLKPFEEVHLSGYQLGDAALTSPNPPDLPSFLSVLLRHTRLRVLDLSFNGLTPQVLVPLLQAIRDLPLLTVLKLSGNRLGSAHGDSSDPLREKWDLSTVHLEEELGEAATASARLGRWLSTNPALRELGLFHCDLNDADVRALLAGLVHPRNSTLQIVQLSYNPSCTSRSAQMALQLVTVLGNTTLCEVELEGVAPVTQVRLEYACTSDGIFRSGSTLIPMGAGAVAAAGDGDNSGKTDTQNASPATADVVDLEQLRQQQQQLMQQLAQIHTRLTPAQAVRYKSRCRYLAEDLDGSRVLAPLVMRELSAVLSTRPRPQRRVTEQYGASEALGVATLAAREMIAASNSGTEAYGHDGGELCKLAAEGGYDGSDSNSGRAAPSPVTTTVTTNSAAGPHQPSPDAAEAKSGSDAGSVAPHPNATDAARPRTSPPMHLRRGRLISAVSTGSVSGSAPGRRIVVQRWQRARTPQELRDSRFETPKRLACVMADAAAFRRRLQPVPLDTRAPPCAEVSRYCGGARSASAAGARPTWYADEDFVLRPNGLTRVLVAPVLPGGATVYNNLTLEDLLDRSLLPCWCTPRQTSPLTGIFAGTLHYHCVHEATAQQQKQRQPQRGASSPGLRSAAATAAKPTAPSTSKRRLPSLLPLQTSPQQLQQPAAPRTHADEKVYCGCQGTGHLCLSARVVSEEAGCGRRRDRMRATLRTKAAKPVGKSTVSVCGASAPRKPDRLHAHFLDWTTTGDDADHFLGTTATTAPPTLHACTVNTARSMRGSSSVKLNYNPANHFTAQHVSCASGMTLAEF
ncbi:hypothetical protein GH5_07978 [Leishmania sp. Ghana 2012 LV757]|uniref:hypothetical protein n=1 Tax=Leishmania sp. Ghana 2012 LV757 TaxID=2803181 RepID=UPI001B67CDE2|nr:hypothetical protein GH5_07978 [Leishmania sp. Ghana 2012 LV757]